MADHPFHPPVKRSVTIAGHPTSISLEPVFWNALEAESRRRSLPVNALVARIDVERMEADAPPNLTYAFPQWLGGEASVGTSRGERVGQDVEIMVVACSFKNK